MNQVVDYQVQSLKDVGKAVDRNLLRKVSWDEKDEKGLDVCEICGAQDWNRIGKVHGDTSLDLRHCNVCQNSDWSY